MSTTLLILNDPPYGSERSYNGLWFAIALVKTEGQKARVFLMATRQQAVAGCGACHSPRHVRERLAAAQCALAIGEMNFKEARAATDAARGKLAPEAFAPVEALLARMRDEDLRDLRFGLGHHSPDYQWRLGQAALDGSLLRIKGALGKARRTASAASTAAK